MILPLLLIPPILVVVSGVFSISMYMTPEYTNAWSASLFKVHCFLVIIYFRFQW